MASEFDLSADFVTAREGLSEELSSEICTVAPAFRGGWTAVAAHTTAIATVKTFLLKH